MVEIYEKTSVDDEVRRIIYQVLVAKEEAILHQGMIEEECFARGIVDKLSVSMRQLIKVTIIDRGRDKVFQAEMHLPYIEKMVIVRLREELQCLSRRDKDSRAYIDELENELVHHSQPWYRKIWR